MKRRLQDQGDRMISGKLRAKTARRGATHATVTVDGTGYAWEERHSWVVWGRGLRVLSVSVWLDPGRTRELVLDLTLKADTVGDEPPERLVRQAVEEGVRAALAEGWVPGSRGRAFRLELPVREA